MDLTSLEKVILDECELKKESPIVVGVSGGPDSLCLLHLMHSLGYSVIAAHVNHQLRPEADQEAVYVNKFADSLGILFFQTRVDVHGFAEHHKLSIEESARLLRYQYLMDIARQNSAQAVAVAHQADDQIETMLMHLLRGAGLSGIKGMTYRGLIPSISSEVPIVRPFLGVWREEILEYCEAQRITPCFDQTNEETRYFRNRIRQELVPLLTTYNAQARQHLWQLSALAGGDDQFLASLAEKTANDLITEQGNGFFAYKRVEFQMLDHAIKRRVIRYMLEKLQSNLRDIGVDAVEKAIEFSGAQPTRAECQLLDSVWLTSFRESELMMCTDSAEFDELWPILTGNQKIQLQIPGKTRINPNWSISAEILPSDHINDINDPGIVVFDYSWFSQMVNLTTAKLNERLLPFGMKGRSVKLGDLFTNLKVYPRARKNWAILKMGEEILWVVNLRRSNFAPVTQNSEKALWLKLIHA